MDAGEILIAVATLLGPVLAVLVQKSDIKGSWPGAGKRFRQWFKTLLTIIWPVFGLVGVVWLIYSGWQDSRDVSLALLAGVFILGANLGVLLMALWFEYLYRRHARRSFQRYVATLESEPRASDS